MQRIKPVNKFYRRYEVDLWGRLSGQNNNKTVRFIKKIQKENLQKIKRNNFFNSKKKKIYKKKNKRKNKSIYLDKKRKSLKNKSKLFKNKSKKGKRRRVNPNKSKKRFNLRRRRYSRKVYEFRIDYVDPQRRKAKTSFSRELFLIKNKLLRYYANIKKHQLRQYANTNTFKLKFKLVRGLGDQNIAKYHNKKIYKKLLALDAFFSLIEHRLDVMLYRSNFAETIQQSRHFIKHNHVSVNGKIVSHSNHILKNFNIVSLNSALALKQFKKIKYNLKRKRVSLFPPKYIYCDYSLMKALLILNPKVSQVPFPFKIDLRKWLGLAKYLI